MTMRPGGELATRPLHFIWIADCSGSMAVDGKIQSLNTAIKEAIPNMQQVADDAKRRALGEKQRADRLAAKLRKLGVDPDA